MTHLLSFALAISAGLGLLSDRETRATAPADRPRPSSGGLTVWFAGGAVRGGFSYGATDELGYHAAENRVSVHDLHATLLHALGIDHARLTFKHQGLSNRLTGVEPARVVNEVLA